MDFALECSVARLVTIGMMVLEWKHFRMTLYFCHFAMTSNGVVPYPSLKQKYEFTPYKNVTCQIWLNLVK